VTEEETQTRGVELLLQEPEIVAWLGDYRRPEPEEVEDDDPPAAA
jgi:hypothetical protein